MRGIIDVNTGEVVVRRGDFMLRALAMGSCIAVMLYDARTKTAGMAHVMLPDSAPEGIAPTTKYAVNAIEQMLDKMAERGTNMRDLEAYLVGGGNVLQKTDDTICASNTESVRSILAEKHIPIMASALGGITRKSVFLDAETGIITYSEGDEPERPLWQPLSKSQNSAAVEKRV